MMNNFNAVETSF